MTDEDRDLYEKELIQILLTHPEFIISLQVKPYYLSKKGNDMLKAILKLYGKDKELSFANIECSKETLDNLIDAITDSNIVILNPKKEFIGIQTKLIENYKRRSLKELSLVALDKKIKSKDYFEKLDKIRSIKYQDEVTYLTESEINNSLKDKDNIIDIPKFEMLNRSLKLCKGDMLTIGASSGLGKTSLMLNLQNALMNKYHCIYINLEMSEPTLIKRMISINSGVLYDSISSPTITPEEQDLVLAGKDALLNARITLINGSNTIEKIEEGINTSLEEKRHNIVFIDHLGLIQGTGKSIYERTTLNAQELRALCIKYGITIIVASQLSRAGQNQDEPDITSFKDSGEVENSSRKAIILFPEDKESIKDPNNTSPTINLKIVKNDTGMLRTIPMTFYKKTQRFKE